MIIAKTPENIVNFKISLQICFSDNGFGICSHAKWPLELGTVDDCTLTCVGHWLQATSLV